MYRRATREVSHLIANKQTGNKKACSMETPHTAAVQSCAYGAVDGLILFSHELRYCFDFR